MMQRQDIRIGNKLYKPGRGPKYLTVKTIKLKSVTSEELPVATGLGILDGIPLTEEWLVLMGFSYEEKARAWHYLSVLRVSFYRGEVMVSFNKIVVPANYVHQVQNLVWSLFGINLQFAGYPQEDNLSTISS